MKASATIRNSINPAWGPAGVSAVEALAAHIEAIERARESDQGNDDWLDILVDEARAIATGRSDYPPQVEHIKALLAELDSARRELDRVRCALYAASLDIEGQPF